MGAHAILAARGNTRFMRLRPKPKTFLDPSRRNWQFEVYAWLLRNTGGFPKFAESALVLPTEEYFPDRGLKGHAGVAALFRRVRQHAGMEDWPFAVEAERDQPRVVEDANIPVITYERGTMLKPISLVAHFAREFARHLLTTIEEPSPGGEAAREAAVELAAVFMGYGLFMANSAASQARFQLSEGELAHALAMFCLLGKRAPDAGDAHLNPHLRKHVRLAARDLAQFEVQFQKLRSLAAVDGGARASPTHAV
jgi:hypothetical protein